MVEVKVIEAFNLMWGNFPEPVMLIHKSREILAVNKACSNLGGAPGAKCSATGSPEQHKGCLANQAIESKQAKYSRGNSGGKEVIGYWIPLTDYPDIYVHFGVGVTINYDKACGGCEAS